MVNTEQRLYARAIRGLRLQGSWQYKWSEGDLAAMPVEVLKQYYETASKAEDTFCEAERLLFDADAQNRAIARGEVVMYG